MSSIRKDVSKILGFTILADEEGTKWEEAFNSLQIEGRMTTKHILQLVSLLLQREEARENEEDRGI